VQDIEIEIVDADDDPNDSATVSFLFHISMYACYALILSMHRMKRSLYLKGTQNRSTEMSGYNPKLQRFLSLSSMLEAGLNDVFVKLD
jgi:ribose/xylose/arabinose/galactoside ABC-type transport system permease subunit